MAALIHSETVSSVALIQGVHLSSYNCIRKSITCATDSTFECRKSWIWFLMYIMSLIIMLHVFNTQLMLLWLCIINIYQSNCPINPVLIWIFNKQTQKQGKAHYFYSIQDFIRRTVMGIKGGKNLYITRVDLVTSVPIHTYEHQNWSTYYPVDWI